MKDVIGSLCHVELPRDEYDRPFPYLVGMSTAAERLYGEYYNQINARRFETEGFDAALLGKAEALAARLALIIHLVRRATNRRHADAEITEQDMKAGITLAKWLAEESKKAYAIVHEDQVEKQRRKLVEWIRSKGGSVTVRDVQRGIRRYRDDADKAKAALDDLVANHVCRMSETIPTSEGGHVVRRYEVI